MDQFHGECRIGELKLDQVESFAITCHPIINKKSSFRLCQDGKSRRHRVRIFTSIFGGKSWLL